MPTWPRWGCLVGCRMPASTERCGFWLDLPLRPHRLLVRPLFDRRSARGVWTAVWRHRRRYAIVHARQARQSWQSSRQSGRFFRRSLGSFGRCILFGIALAIDALWHRAVRYRGQVRCAIRRRFQTGKPHARLCLRRERNISARQRAHIERSWFKTGQGARQTRFRRRLLRLRFRPVDAIAVGYRLGLRLGFGQPLNTLWGR